jgi:hypothetical protein
MLAVHSHLICRGAALSRFRGVRALGQRLLFWGGNYKPMTVCCHFNRYFDKLQIVMQYIIEREIPSAGSLSEIQIREISLRSMQALTEIGPQIQWLHSYVTEDKLYCVYIAPDENVIQEHARRSGIPADRVSAVRRMIDPARLN